jgi:hypothetical protein
LLSLEVDRRLKADRPQIVSGQEVGLKEAGQLKDLEGSGKFPILGMSRGILLAQGAWDCL